MKKSLFAVLISGLMLVNCKSEKKEEVSKPEKEASIMEKIAQANGYENWKNIEELRFTFNVDRDSSHFERKWIWNTRAHEVTGISLGDSAAYDRRAIDGSLTKVDAAFINDKYWLLAPFQLLWDQQSFTYEHSEVATAPMSQKPMQKLTIVYGDEGGYTPGDAYDFYFGEDYLVKEWVFRKANQEEPSMVTSWEDYADYGGLKLAKTHKKPDENFSLYFTDIEVKTVD